MDDDKVNEHDVENHPKIKVQVEEHPISWDMSDVNEGIISTKGDDRNGGSDDDGSSSSENTIEEIKENGDRADGSAKDKEREDAKYRSGAKNKDRSGVKGKEQRSQWCKGQRTRRRKRSQWCKEQRTEKTD